MGIFQGKAGEEIADLELRIKDHELRQKKLAETLAIERKRSAAMEIELGQARAEVAEARVAVARARSRQKASVERANRFKARMGKNPGMDSITLKEFL